jgi:hypothetical protein
MRTLSPFALCITLLVLIANVSTIGAMDSSCIKLEKNQKYIADFQLNSRESRILEIESDEEVWLGFKPHTTSDHREKLKDKFPVKIYERIPQKDGTYEEGYHRVGCLLGCAAIFSPAPADGKIRFRIANESDQLFAVKLYTKPYLEKAKNPWYTLKEGQNYLKDFSLNTGESEYLEIKSEKEIWVGFDSNAPVSLGSHYKRKFPIQVHQKFTTDQGKDYYDYRFGSLHGGGTRFTPVNGKIEIRVTNGTQRALRIVVWTESKN